MSKKIIFSEELKREILEYSKNTYQCTLGDLVDHFHYRRQAFKNNFDDGFFDSLFKGTTDRKKAQISKTLTGVKQSEETKKKRKASVLEFYKNMSPEKKEEMVENRQLSRKINAEKHGLTIEESYQKGFEKTKATKLKRYGDENYNNPEKGKATRLELYGDENFNNKEKIKETQFELYGGYAFNNREKVVATNLRKYGVPHNWASKDPKLNGSETRYKMYGSKEEYYKHVMEKSKATRLELYGDEFYSNSEQAQRTMLERYGVPFYSYTEDFQSKSWSPEARAKRIRTMRERGSFTFSSDEEATYTLLREFFSKDEVFREYQDERYSNDSGYKYKCDFYIKPMDLFIELNIYPTHGKHPFDPNSEEDKKTLKLLESNPTDWNKMCIKVWTISDFEKIKKAKQNNLNYLAFYPSQNYKGILREKIQNFKVNVI